LSEKEMFSKEVANISKTYGKKDENWSVLNFLNTIPELEKFPKIKKRKNLKTFFSRSKSLQRRRNFREK
jgi:hypothetical protein